MTPARLTLARLRQLADELPDRHTTPLLHLSRARVLTGGQLDRLLDERQPDTAARTAQRARQRAMAQLAALGLVNILDRRIGGARAGSAGHVHVLSTAGHTLAALLHGKTPPGRIRRSRVPGPMFLAHAIDIAEIYVQLTEHSRGGGFTIAAFVTEPDTWWHQHGVHLRPDAYTVLRVPSHRDCWWLEIDRATESLPRLRDKLHAYLYHHTTGGLGPHGASPRVLITAPDLRRCGVVTDLITGLPPPAGELFCAVEHHRAARFLITAVHDMGET
jgi:hypothetical protein